MAAATLLLGKLLAALPDGPPPPPPPPPAPLPEPAAAGFTGSAGACRDGNGDFGTRVEANGSGLNLTQCEAACLSFGSRLDAYDWGFQGNGSAGIHGIWCGCWGATFTRNDNQTIGGVAFTYADGGGKHQVCRGNNGHENFCYYRSTITCGGGSDAGPCLPGCTCGL